MEDRIKFRGTYKVQYSEGGVLIAERKVENLMPTAMVNHLLDVTYGGATQTNPWYIGLINNTPAPTVAITDVLTSHAGWVEFTGYSGNRKEWIENAASARVKLSTSSASFTLTSGGTIWGIFLASVASGTSGILGSEGAFEAPLPVISGGTINAVFGIEVE